MTRDYTGEAGSAVETMLQQFAGPPPAAAPGPALEADAHVSLQIGRLATAIDRDRSDRAAQRRDRSHAIFPFYINPALIQGSGTLSQPYIMSPPEGYWWDIRNIKAASFSAGTVTVYTSPIATDANIEFVFTSAGTYTPGSGNLFLGPGDQLLFVAAGITGNVTISGRAISVRADYVADYLL